MEDQNDFELDDEFVTKEEFLVNVEEVVNTGKDNLQKNTC